MATVNLTRTDSGYVRHAPQCAGCPGCAAASQVVRLPINAAAVSIELSLYNQWQLLFHSWLLPLFSAIVACIACKTLNVAEGWSVLAITMTFILGISFCRIVPISALKISSS